VSIAAAAATAAYIPLSAAAVVVYIPLSAAAVVVYIHLSAAVVAYSPRSAVLRKPYYILKTNYPFLFWVPDGYDPDHFRPWAHPFISMIVGPTGSGKSMFFRRFVYKSAAAVVVYIHLSAAVVAYSPRSAVLRLFRRNTTVRTQT
jgi:hypothetical protein